MGKVFFPWGLIYEAVNVLIHSTAQDIMNFFLLAVEIFTCDPWQIENKGHKRGRGHDRVAEKELFVSLTKISGTHGRRG